MLAFALLWPFLWAQRTHIVFKAEWDKSCTFVAADIEIPSIVERGYRDEFMDFKGGGRIHLILSFALTDEERRKIQIMVCQLFRCVGCCLLS